MSQSGEQSVLERNLAALRRVGSGAERVLRQAAPLARQAAQFPRELPADIYCFILQGMQPPEMLHELLNREGRDRIFFVFEREAGAALDALSRCDLSEGIAAGRLLLFVGPQAGKDLEQTLFNNDSVPMPEWILPADPEGAEYYRQQSNVTFTRMLQRRQYVIQYMADELKEYYTETSAARAREITTGEAKMKVMLYDPRSGVEGRFASELAEAFAELGQDVALCRFRSPEQPSIFPVLKRITACKPDVFLAFSASRPSIGVWIAPEVPLAFYLLRPEENLLNASVEAPLRLTGSDAVIASCARYHEGLVASGLDPARLAMIAPGVSVSSGEPEPIPEQERSGLVFIGDATDVNPIRLGLKEDSALLWQHVGRLVQEQGPFYSFGQAGALVHKACAGALIEFDLEQHENYFSLLAECRLARQAQREGLLEALSARFPLKILGSGWGSCASLGPRADPAPQDAASLSREISRAAAAVYIDSCGVPGREFLEAARAQVAILANRSALDGQSGPEAFAAGKEVLVFDTRKEMFGMAKRLLTNRGLRQRLAAAAFKKASTHYHIRSTAERVLGFLRSVFAGMIKAQDP